MSAVPSVSGVALAVGLFALVCGGTLGAYGVYQQTTDTCESGTGLTVHRLAANETADPALERVAYENLSAAEQEVFREILTAETTPVYQQSGVLDGLTRKVVTYRGGRYETSRQFESDCFGAGETYAFLGGVVALLGGLVAGGAYGWRRRR
ncbi:hypothetical protein [Halorussus aquaticus]|uniref:DUF7979 domain-containing protein n=1 Tax=Halorussus aquaticus TaxID=2953748 RepID=A0ABD5Q876_9EURY|nr:hypothetical protein [Halorussus aquaticus]